VLSLRLPGASALATRTPLSSPAPLPLSTGALGLGTTASGFAGALVAPRLPVAALVPLATVGPLSTLRLLALRRVQRGGRRSRLP
jgi:hypothetical protein